MLPERKQTSAAFLNSHEKVTISKNTPIEVGMVVRIKQPHNDTIIQVNRVTKIKAEAGSFRFNRLTGKKVGESLYSFSATEYIFYKPLPKTKTIHRLPKIGFARNGIRVAK